MHATESALPSSVIASVQPRGTRRAWCHILHRHVRASAPFKPRVVTHRLPQ